MEKTQTERVAARLPVDLVKEIDDLMFATRKRNRTQAIIVILRAGLDALKNEKAPANA